MYNCLHICICCNSLCTVQPFEVVGNIYFNQQKFDDALSCLTLLGMQLDPLLAQLIEHWTSKSHVACAHGVLQCDNTSPASNI